MTTYITCHLENLEYYINRISCRNVDDSYISITLVFVLKCSSYSLLRIFVSVVLDKDTVPVC